MVAEELLNTQNIVDARFSGPAVEDGLFRIIFKARQGGTGPADRADDAVHQVHDRHQRYVEMKTVPSTGFDGGKYRRWSPCIGPAQSAGYRKHPAHQAGTDAGQGFRDMLRTLVFRWTDRARRGAGQPGRLSAVAPGFLIAALPTGCRACSGRIVAPIAHCSRRFAALKAIIRRCTRGEISCRRVWRHVRSHSLRPFTYCRRTGRVRRTGASTPDSGPARRRTAPPAVSAEQRLQMAGWRLARTRCCRWMRAKSTQRALLHDRHAG